MANPRLVKLQCLCGLAVPRRQTVLQSLLIINSMLQDQIAYYCGQMHWQLTQPAVRCWHRHCQRMVAGAHGEAVPLPAVAARKPEPALIPYPRVVPVHVWELLHKHVTLARVLLMVAGAVGTHVMLAAVGEHRIAIATTLPQHLVVPHALVHLHSLVMLAHALVSTHG